MGTITEYALVLKNNIVDDVMKAARLTSGVYEQLEGCEKILRHDDGDVLFISSAKNFMDVKGEIFGVLGPFDECDWLLLEFCEEYNHRESNGSYHDNLFSVCPQTTWYVDEEDCAELDEAPWSNNVRSLGEAVGNVR